MAHVERRISPYQFRRIAYDKVMSWLHVDDVILRHISDAVMVLDRRQRIIYLNPACEVLLGYDSTEILYQDVRRLLDHEETLKYWHIRQTVLRGETWQGEMTLQCADHRLATMNVTVAPVANDDSEIKRLVVILQRGSVLARHMQIIANLVHDVGNIVANLRLRLVLLARRPDKLSDHVTMMEKHTTQLETLLRELFTLSQLQDNTLVSPQTPVNLNHIVEQVVDTYQAAAETRQLRLTFEPDSQIPLIAANGDQLARVISNLLANALNYTPAGGRILLRTANTGAQVMFAIRDTGIGIEPQALGRIFERFYRTPHARQTGGGTGLGLAIVKELVERHRGRIVVESAPGQGTEFRVYLPRIDKDSPTEPGD